ncbi:hypothetical protein [Streptomyces sp. NPDC059455]|uniref:baeRF2 domain-containing protein n=1 Tax=Streptomyces sp. NPDC059455 TaxID=3346837 RepID=UPI0036A747FF
MRLGHLQPLYDRPGPWAGVYFDTTHPDESAAEEQERAAREASRRLEGQGAEPMSEPPCWSALPHVGPLLELTGADLVVPAGDPRERRAVHERLPKELRSAAVETARGGRAPGVPALADAARGEHGIGSLLIRPDGPDLYREVRVGTEPDQLALRRTDVQYVGDTRPSPARADDTPLRRPYEGDAD